MTLALKLIVYRWVKIDKEIIMELQIVEKGSSLNLDIASKSDEAGKRFYFGAGWDNPNGPVDLDIVAVALKDGKLADGSGLVYFGNRSIPGIELSEDNTTGEGEGDDESIVINTGDLPADVDSVVIGLAAYSTGADMHNAPNPHFRACDGAEESSEQIADIPAGAGVTGDTVLVAFKLDRTDAGWVMQNVGEFHQKGNGQDAIKGFAELHAA